MDDGSSKNAHFIDELEKKKSEVQEIYKFLKERYNNRENSIVITKLQEAEDWLNRHIDSLR